MYLLQVAVIGPNAKIAAYCGGGSASLLPYYAITPFDGIKAQATDVKYSLGVTAYKKLPFLSYLTKTKSGEPGLTMKVYLDPPSKKDREQVDEVYTRSAEVMLMDYKHPRLPENNLYYLALEGQFTPDETDTYQFSVSVAGTAKVFVDGKLVVDNETKQVMGDSFFGSGTREEIGEMKLQKGKTYNISITVGTLPTMTVRSPGATSMGAGGVRAGCTRKTNAKVELEKAVALAKEVDQVVICAGLNVSSNSSLGCGSSVLFERSNVSNSPILNPKAMTGQTWTCRLVPTR
jgi:beta-glucosidase